MSGHGPAETGNPEGTLFHAAAYVPTASLRICGWGLRVLLRVLGTVPGDTAHLLGTGCTDVLSWRSCGLQVQPCAAISGEACGKLEA